MVSPGSKVGPYEILTRLGAGGMGEVWKARDERLDRIVAIKFCKEEFTTRFAREARVVASLNHPHIATLYDIGPNYLVMEFVEGTPLRGPVSVDEAVRYCEQILEALDGAHRQFIVHRDLKPANILVTRQGSVKLLDFGLARVQATDTTVTDERTLLGTPAYMSPEQWNNTQADTRSDIYSFGCVLYELLTGQRVGPQRTPVSIPHLEYVIKGCLEKNPEDRWQSARDVRRALKLGPTSNHRTGRRWMAGGVALAALALGLAGFVQWRSARENNTLAPVRFTVVPPSRNQLEETVVSPNGMTLAMAAGEQGKTALWLRTLDSLSPRLLPGTEGARFPFWSPDGKFLAFFVGSKLLKIDASGSVPPQLVSEFDGFPQGGAWTPDGNIIIGIHLSGLFRVPSVGGEMQPLTRLNPARKETRHSWPSMLPDGEHFVFAATSADPAMQGVWAASIRKPEERTRIVGDFSRADYSEGQLLFVRNSSLVAQPFDLDSLAVSGEAIPLAGAVNYDPAGGWSDFSASDTGTLTVGPPPRRMRMSIFDRAGKPLQVFGEELGRYQFVSLSPRQDVIAADAPDAKFGYEIFLLDPARGTTTRLTFGQATGNFPVWSPDGSRVAFGSNRDGVYNIYVKAAAGSAKEDLIFKNDRNKFLMDWSKDGRLLLFGELDPGKRKQDLWTVEASGGKTPTAFIRDDFDHRDAKFSPDGRWVAYASAESGMMQVFVRSFPSGSVKQQVSSRGGSMPRWRDDGREMYYLEPDGQLMAVAVAPGGQFNSGPPQALFRTALTGNLSGYDVYSGGQRFAMPSPVVDPSEAVSVVLNWARGTQR